MPYTVSYVISTAVSLFAVFSQHVRAQAGPNTMAVFDPSLRTFSSNGTYFIVPMNRTAVQALVQYPLLPVPVQNTTIFPNGFPSNTHPAIVGISYENDIRMATLEINSLMEAEIYFPFVDRLGDGQTPFIYPETVYIGGTDGQGLMSTEPALVGTLEGTTALVGTFMPDTAAYMSIGDDLFSAQVKQVILPNPLSGPGIVPSAVDTLFTTAASSNYTAATFPALLNQPIILNNGMCQNNVLYFNQSFTNGILRTGNVTLYTPTVPSSIAGIYSNVGGYSANPVMVGFNAQNCSAAAQSILQEKLQ